MEWISVKDRLPEYESTVIVNAEGFESEGYQPLLISRLMKITIDRNGEKLEWDDFQNIGLVSVTHWMPLPEPPKSN